MSNDESLLISRTGSSDKIRTLEKDFISKINGLGSLSSAQTDNLRGINVNKTGAVASKNKDRNGLTFFTRPDFNLTDGNLSANRVMSTLLGSSPDSMNTALRCMLDPRSERTFENRVISDIFDSTQAFIPVLTNNLISISGWPDIALSTYTSKEGLYRESFSMVDDTAHIFNTFDITANFKNIQGDPITLLFTLWTLYSAFVYDGTMVPYPDMIIKNEIDYNTRIYRLVMDESNTIVTKIAACGAAFPMASPIGASFNYSNESVYSTDNDQISIPFRCMGASYLDPILVTEFNKCVVDKNLAMSDSVRSSTMRKVSNSDNIGDNSGKNRLLMNYLNSSLHPRIEPTTMELEWYARVEDVEDAIRVMKARGVL